MSQFEVFQGSLKSKTKPPLSSNKLRTTLCCRIRRARKDLGLSQDEAGKLLGWRQTRVSKIERGALELTALDLYELGRVFNKPLEWFFDSAIDIP